MRARTGSAGLRSVHLRWYLLASLFAALTATGAFIRLPLPYVPLTLQTFFVMLSGAVLGPKFGALSQVLYLVVGLLGLPVFAQGGGLGYVFQPTFGYLLGYPFAAFVAGHLIWGRRSPRCGLLPDFKRIFIGNAAGLAIVFLLGVTWLYYNLKLVAGKPVSFGWVMWTGWLIFIPGDVVKLLLSTFVAQKLNRLMLVAN